MATLTLVKTLSGLRAADDSTAKVLRGLALGEVVTVTHRQPRNLKFFRKWWAMVRRVYESCDNWPSAEVLNDLVCIAVGHCDLYVMQDGRPYYKPRSISFAEMDDTSFHQFYERGLDALCELAGGIESDALREAVLQELSQ